MKFVKPLIFFILLFAHSCLLFSQHKTQKQIKAEKAFIKMLNEVAVKYPMNDFATSDSIAKLIQPFTLNNKNEISAAWRVPTDSGFYLIKKIVPLKEIRRIFYDDYIGFVSDKNKITISTSKANSTAFTEIRPYFLFHIARVGEDKDDWHTQLQDALDDLRPYYP